MTSIDLNACKDVDSLDELFNFGNDYLGLVKAAVVASGLIPPALEGTNTPLSDLLATIVRPGLGLEIVSKVNDIPKGSRLAVSTNLLASLISVMMRATGQVSNLTGGLGPEESKVVVARAILGEWLGGSGGGWQDSGGVFPGIKLIEGVTAVAGRPGMGRQQGPAASFASPVEPARGLTANRTRLELNRMRPIYPRPWQRASSSFTAGWRRTSGRSSTWSPPSICFAIPRRGSHGVRA